MEEVKIHIGIEDSGADAGMKRIIAGMEATQREVKRTGVDISDLEGSLKRLDKEALASAAKFRESSEAAGRLKDELRGLAEGGASADVLISKARELSEAQRNAAQAGAEALMTNQKYWTALGLAGEDISEVQRRHAELSQSYTDMTSRAAATQATVTEYSRKLDEENRRLQETKEKADGARKSTDDIKESTDRAANSSKNFAERLNEVKEGSRNLPGPLGDAISGVNGLTKATLRFVATPLGATLALISAALATVTSWFKRTEEGQNALATGSAYFTQVLGSLLDVADDAGEWLYKAFTKPKEALNDLVDFLKGQVINRIQAIGEMAQGIWKILQGDFSEGFSQLGNGYLQGLTGVKGVTEKVSSWMSDTNKKADERVRIAQRQNKLDADERKSLVERAKLEKEINELRQKAYDRSVPEKERAKALQSAEQKTKKMYDEELRLAKERYEIIRDTNSLTHSNKDDKKKEAEAEAELYRVESQRATALKGLMREQNRVDGSVAKSAKEDVDRRAKEKAEELKHSEEMAKIKRDAERAQEDAAIAAIKNQGERERAEREVQHRREIEDLKAQEQEVYQKIYEQRKKAYETANKGKKYENTVEGAAGWGKDKDGKYVMAGTLNANEKKQWQTWFDGYYAKLTQLNAVWVREQQQREEALIKSHQSYTDAKIAIDKKYRDDVGAINAAIAEAEARGDQSTVEALKRSIGEAEKERAKSQADLSLKQLKEDPEYIRAFEDLDNTSTETLEHLIKMFEEAKTAAGRSLDPKDLKEYTDAIEQMQEKVFAKNKMQGLVDSTKKLRSARIALKSAEENLNKVRHDEKIQVGVIQKANGELEARYMTLEEAEEQYRQSLDDEQEAQAKHRKKIDETCNSVDELAAQISNLGSAIGGQAGQILGLVGDITTFVTGCITGIQSMAEMGSDAIGTIEKASVVIGIISTALQIGQKIASLFGESEEEKQARKEREKMVMEMTANVALYRMEVLRARQEEEKWFSSTGLSNLSDKWNESRAAMSEYYKVAQDYSDNITKSLANWNYASDQLYSKEHQKRKVFYDELQQSLNDAGNAFDTLVKNEFDQYETLSSFIKRVYNEDLFDSDGIVNTTVLDDFLNNYSDRLMNNDAEGLKAISELAKQYKEWQSTLQEYISDLYSPFADDLTDALWDWYENGTDVMKSFKENARDTFQSISKEMMKELVNNIVFDELKKKLTEAYTAYAKDASNPNALNNLVSSLETAMTEFETTTEAALPTLQMFMTRLGGMSERLFGSGGVMAESFDDMRSAFRDALVDMEGDASDFEKTIKEKFFNALVDNFVMTDEFDEYINEMATALDKLAKASYVDKEGNLFSDEDLRSLDEQIAYYSKIAEDYTQSNEVILEARQKIEELIRQREEMLLGSEELTDEERLKRQQDIIEAAEKEYAARKETVKLYAELLGISKELAIQNSPLANIGDDIMSVLQDTEKSAKDWKKEIVKTMTDDLVKELVYNDEYKEQMREYQEQYVAIMSDTSLDEAAKAAALQELADQMAGYVEEAERGVRQTQELMGVLDDIESPFGNLHDTFLSELTSMEADAEKFKANLNKTLVQDLIDKQVLGKAIEANGNVFENFDAYTEDWNERYVKAVKANNIDLIDSLIEEMMQVRDLTLQEAEELRQRLQKDADTTFKNMGDSLASNLMDASSSAEAWAENIGKTMADKILKEMVMTTVLQPALDKLQEVFNASLKENDGDWGKVMADENIKAAIDAVVAAYPEMKAAAEKLYAAFGIKDELPFSDIRNEFVSTLLDMEGDAEKLGKNVAKKLLNEMLGQLLDKEFAKELAEIRQLYQDVLDGKATWEQLEQKVVEVDNAMAKHPGITSLTNAYKKLDESMKELPLSDIGNTILSSLTDLEYDAEEFGKQIALKLMNEMLAEMLDSRYAERINEIRKHWQSALSGKEDENGVVHTLESVKEEIIGLNNEIQELGENDPITGIANGIKELSKVADTTFSSMGDSWASSLMDMNADAGDFGREIGKTLVSKLVKELIIGKELQQYLDDVQAAYDEALNLYGDEEDAVERIIEHVTPAMEALNEQTEKQKPIVEGIVKAYEKVEEEVGEYESMTETFVSSLMDMESSAEDFGKEIGQTLAKNIIDKFLVEQEIQPLLKKFQGVVDAAMNMEGATTKSVLDDEGVNRVLDEIAEKYPAIQEMIQGIMGKLGLNKKDYDGFSDLRGMLLESFTEIDTDAETWGKNIAVSMMESMLDAYTDSTYGEQMKAISERWGKVLSGEETTDTFETILADVKALQAQMAGDTTLTDYADKIKDAKRELDTTFSSMADSWASVLTDMDAKASDFGTEIGRTLVNKMVREVIVGDKLQKHLDSIQEAFNESSEKHGDDIVAVLEDITPLIDEAVKESEQWKDAIGEIQKRFEQIANETPFDNLRSNFLSSLMDMTSDMNAFASDINKTITEAFIDSFVLGTAFDDQLEQWKERYGEIIRGELTREEQAALLSQLKSDIVEAKRVYSEEARRIHELMGTTGATDQSAYMNTAQGFTYDQADLVGGMVTSLVMGQSEGNEVRRHILSTLESLASIMTPDRGYGEEIFNRLGTTNEYLLAIKTELDRHLGNIALNTTNLTKL